MVTSFGCWCSTLMLRDRGYWWPKWPKTSLNLQIVTNNFHYQFLSFCLSYKNENFKFFSSQFICFPSIPTSNPIWWAAFGQRRRAKSRISALIRPVQYANRDEIGKTSSGFFFKGNAYYQYQRLNHLMETFHISGQRTKLYIICIEPELSGYHFYPELCLVPYDFLAHDRIIEPELWLLWHVLF